MSLEKLVNHRSGEPPLICLEVNPPRGTDIESVLSRLDGSITGLDLFNVTDSALARMRLAPLPFGAMLKQRFGIDPVVNVSCRDRNLIAIQGDLLAGWAQGVRSVVALTGDAVTVGDSPDRKGVFEVNSVGLLGAINTLNSGKDLAGNELAGTPQFCAGVVVNPNARNAAAELKKLRRKKDAGAKFALSQPVFDKLAAREFFNQARECGIPVMMGLLPLSSVRSTHSISQVPGIKLPDELVAKVDALPQDEIKGYFIDYCLEIARYNREYVAGFHVVSGTTPRLALRLARALVDYRDE